MGLSDDDKKEVLGIVTGALGVPEGKTLADVIGEQVNTTVNAYDKRKSKETSALADAVKGITEKLTALESKGEDDDDADDGDAGGKKKGALPPEVAEQLKAFEKRTKVLEQQLDAEKKARETEKAEREKVEKQNADRARIDTVRQALAKAGITDPESIDFALDHLEHRGLVSMTEDGKAYQFKTGTDAANEPTFAPLEAGLKEWVTKGAGKRFIPAVPGNGNPVPGGGRPAPTGGELTVEQAASMSSTDIEKAIAEGRLQATQPAG